MWKRSVSKLLISLPMVLMFVAITGAEDKPATVSPSASGFPTKEQFEAMPPDTVLQIGTRRITKREWLAERKAAFERAMKAYKLNIQKLQAEFQAKRRAFKEQQRAELDAANRKIAPEVERLRKIADEARGPNFQARLKEANELLEKKKTATEAEMSELNARARKLLESMHSLWTIEQYDQK
jgi:hypothetical protein